ncbi:MAG TPA: hypothetical protein VLF60_04925 [Candidatus Saccharimonadales bacterium]|nr:hypothetical protein [Candidatus Saccharimonadales bacterium]
MSQENAFEPIGHIDSPVAIWHGLPLTKTTYRFHDAWQHVHTATTAMLSGLAALPENERVTKEGLLPKRRAEVTYYTPKDTATLFGGFEVEELATIAFNRRVTSQGKTRFALPTTRKNAEVALDLIADSGTGPIEKRRISTTITSLLGAATVQTCGVTMLDDANWNDLQAAKLFRMYKPDQFGEALANFYTHHHIHGLLAAIGYCSLMLDGAHKALALDTLDLQAQSTDLYNQTANISNELSPLLPNEPAWHMADRHLVAFAGMRRFIAKQPDHTNFTVPETDIWFRSKSLQRL